MADPVTQDAGGGEGHTPGQPSVPAQDSKPVDPVKIELVAEIKAEVPETKSEVVPEVKSAESPAPNPAEAVANVPDTEVKANDEVKVAEAKPEVADTAAEIKAEIKADAPAAEVKSELLEAKQNNLSDGDAGGANNWQQRELALLKKIEELEKVKNESSQNSTKMELKIREEEIDLLKARVRNLETELQAALSKPGPKNHEMIENIKQQHEELLSKARGMIFDKTKMVKNQELQIEALTTQVQSLKDINLITKDLLEIRNSEIKAMEDRLQAMEARFSKEKERYGLVLQRAQTSTNINDDLKKEYETQLKIFKELRTKYEQKVEALVAENNKLKLELVRAGGSVPSTEAPK